MTAKEIRKIRHIREEDAVSPVIATILMVAITVVLAGTLYVWAANLAESNTGDTLELYSFTSRDSAGSPSLATDDNLAIVTMSQGDPIGWASLTIRVSVDGGASFNCALPGQSAGDCIVLEAETTDGGLWSVGEDITIKENGLDLCNADICELKITITNSRSGNVLGSTTTETEQGGAAVALPRSETVTVGPDGAVIQIQGAVISIPQGALSVDTELTFEALTASDLFALGDEDIDGYSIPTTFLKLTPHGTTFSQPVTVTLRVTDSMPITPVIYTKSDDNGDWEEFTGQLNIGANTITFELYSFSYYFGTSATADDVNRISYWWGKVNQHFENGAWATDPDGSSGANIDMLQYCQKWWPDTVSVQELPERESIIFYNAGNSGYFPTMKPVFECVSPDDGTGGGGSGGGGGDPNACSEDSDCLAGGYCLNGVCVYDDQDMDGISDNQDNCPANANADQADVDGNGVGNACDACYQIFGGAVQGYELVNGNCVDIDECAVNNGGCGQDTCINVDGSHSCDQCAPDCAGCECGDDGCGGSCGTCPNGETCNSNQLCVECQTAADCASGICANEVCVDCISDQDCPSGTLCDGNGECISQGYGVVTWGSSPYGGDSSSVSAQLSSGVTEIFPSYLAFAALKSDGSVVTWGDSNNGGDSSSVSSSLSSGVTEIFSTDRAFAALKSDGSVVTWGRASFGGDSSSVSSSLSSGVTEIFSTNNGNGGAFAALKSDGSVVTWGTSGYGADSSSVSSQLSSGVTEIFSTNFAFAALKSDGSVVTWGGSASFNQGGDSSSVSSQISSGVTEIFSTNFAFAALKSDGSVVTWGTSGYGADSSSVSSQLSSGVTEIFSSVSAFAALKSDGSVVTWGESTWGGDSSSVSSQISSGVTEIFSSDSAFAALKSDGSVVTWGHYSNGDSSSVSSQISSGVTEIFPSDSAFAALKSDGSVVTWGVSGYGGDSSSVSSQISSGITEIFSTDRAFAALKSDGSVVTWGAVGYGANSNSESFSLSSGVIEIFSTSYAFAALDSDGANVPADGTPCDDGDPNTTGDVYTNGVCQGTQSNLPPEISYVAIQPNPIYNTDDADCLYSASDSDGGIASITTSWTVNGQTGANYLVNPLPSSNFDAGDVLICSVRAEDDDGDYTIVNSSPITVSNSLPVVTGLTFDSTSSGIFTHTTHNCLFSVSDADGDAVTTIVRWYADGVLIGTGPTITLTSSLISVGQNLQCEVTPNDGTVDGQTVITPINANSVVQNSSPSISSVVIGYSSQQHSSGTFAGDVLTCTASGADIDNDALTFAYTWYLNGASHSTGQNLDTTGMSSNDIVHCSAIANDGTDNSASVDSASTTVFTIHNIDIQNMAYSPSSITITAGDIIIWTNLDNMGHSVTSDDGTTFDSGLISNSQTFTLTGLSIGTYGYHCTPHPSMTGTIIVQ